MRTTSLVPVMLAGQLCIRGCARSSLPPVNTRCCFGSAVTQMVWVQVDIA